MAFTRLLVLSRPNMWLGFCYGLPVFAGLLYAWLLFSAPILDVKGTLASKLSITLTLSIVILQVLVWLIAARGVWEIKRYSMSIAESPDGKALNYIASALGWLLMYIVVVALFGTLAVRANGTEFARLSVALRNHIPLIALAVAVYYLYKGARQLRALISYEAMPRLYAAGVAGMFVMGSALLVIHVYDSTHGVESVTAIPRFVIPIKILIFTYILPQLLIFLAGITAIYSLSQYGGKVEGSIYRILFKNVSRGIALVFVSIFIAQLIMSSSVDVSHFNPLVALIYAVLLVATYGFVLIYQGARSLSKLETLT